VTCCGRALAKKTAAFFPKIPLHGHRVGYFSARKFMNHKFAITGLLAFLITALPAFSQNDAVYSVNIIGMQKVEVPPASIAGGRQLVGVPFDSMPGNLDQIVGNTGVASSQASLADNIIIYDPLASASQKYKTYYLRVNTSNSNKPMWRFAGTPQFWATNVYLYPGDGFWYVNRAAQVLTNSMVGDVVMDDEVNISILPGLQLLSYPFSSSTTLGGLGLTNGVANSVPSLADGITIFDPYETSQNQYKTYYLRLNGSTPSWRTTTSPQQWASNVVVEARQGFWYNSKTATGFTWRVIRPYDL
jgi:hypothetical protein